MQIRCHCVSNGPEPQFQALKFSGDLGRVFVYGQLASLSLLKGCVRPGQGFRISIAPLLLLSRISQRPPPIVAFKSSFEIDPATFNGKSVRILPKDVLAATR